MIVHFADGLGSESAATLLGNVDLAVHLIVILNDTAFEALYPVLFQCLFDGDAVCWIGMKHSENRPFLSVRGKQAKGCTTLGQVVVALWNWIIRMLGEPNIPSSLESLVCWARGRSFGPDATIVMECHGNNSTGPYIQRSRIIIA
jgi:hypothetical protein